jgi:LSD1 subclass zinc finger protein
MAELQSSTCPNCGSPLDVKPGDTRIKCSYCGSSIVVSEHENSTLEFPQFTLKIDEQTAHEIGAVGKVTAGIALSSMILPLLLLWSSYAE